MKSIGSQVKMTAKLTAMLCGNKKVLQNIICPDKGAVELTNKH